MSHRGARSRGRPEQVGLQQDLLAASYEAAQAAQIVEELFHNGAYPWQVVCIAFPDRNQRFHANSLAPPEEKVNLCLLERIGWCDRMNW